MIWSEINLWYVGILQPVIPLLWVLSWSSNYLVTPNMNRVSLQDKTMLFGELGVWSFSLLMMLWNRPRLNEWYRREIYMMSDIYARYRYESETYKFGEVYDINSGDYVPVDGKRLQNIEALIINDLIEGSLPMQQMPFRQGQPQ